MRIQHIFTTFGALCALFLLAMPASAVPVSSLSCPSLQESFTTITPGETVGEGYSDVNCRGIAGFNVLFELNTLGTQQIGFTAGALNSAGNFTGPTIEALVAVTGSTTFWVKESILDNFAGSDFGFELFALGANTENISLRMLATSESQFFPATVDREFDSSDFNTGTGAQVVPLPAGFLLLLSGIAGFGGFGWLKRRTRTSFA